MQTSIQAMRPWFQPRKVHEQWPFWPTTIRTELGSHPHPKVPIPIFSWMMTSQTRIVISILWGKKNMHIFPAKTSITLGFQMCDIIDIMICWILEAKHKSDHFDSPLHHHLKGLEKHMKGSTGEQLPICCMETDLRNWKVSKQMPTVDPWQKI